MSASVTPMSHIRSSARDRLIFCISTAWEVTSSSLGNHRRTRTSTCVWRPSADSSCSIAAAGSRRAAILAATDSGPIAILFAAMHPELVSALVLFNTTARYLEADDYPIGAPPEAIDATVQLIATGWGTDEFTRLANPSMADD